MLKAGTKKEAEIIRDFFTCFKSGVPSCVVKEQKAVARAPFKPSFYAFVADYFAPAVACAACAFKKLDLAFSILLLPRALSVAHRILRDFLLVCA